MAKQGINEEIDARIDAIVAFRGTGKFFDYPTAINEMLKAICDKNEIRVPLLDKQVQESVKNYKDAVAEDVANISIRLVDTMRDLPERSLVISETVDVDDYRVKIIVARKPIKPRKDL